MIDTKEEFNALCTKDFIMCSGERAFTKGHVYFFEYDSGKQWLTIDDQGESHWMELPDLKDFVRVEHAQTEIKVEMGGVDPTDYPDFCDAYIERAWHADGTEMTEEEIRQYEADHPEVVNEEALFSAVDSYE